MQFRTGSPAASMAGACSCSRSFQGRPAGWRWSRPRPIT